MVWATSCAVNNQKFFTSRRKRLLLFFLILWLCTGTVLFLYTITLKKSIQQQRISQITTALNTYIEYNTPFGNNHFSLQGSLPDAIDFVRFIQGDEQILIVSDNTMTFNGLVDINPHYTAAWIDISNPKKSGDWILVSPDLTHGGVAQAGANDLNTGIFMYKRAVRISYLLFLLSVLPSLGLSFFFVHATRSPLRSLEHEICNALEQRTTSSFPSSPNDDDLIPLYQLLDQTFTQNRQLITTIQASLDNVAHDLRTPMTRLRAVAEYALQSDKTEPGIYRNALSDCLEESERVLSMLRIMMSVAEAEAGTMRLDLHEFEILDTLKDVMELYQYVAEENKISISLDNTKNTISIFADKTRISQVWANLLDNAIKYGHETGNVAINLMASNAEAIIQFSDNGMGISDTEIDRIWERLYRGDRSRTKQGLGLGLNYVKAVVEAHGGTISVTSAIKNGSSFEVRLPLACIKKNENHRVTEHDQRDEYPV